MTKIERTPDRLALQSGSTTIVLDKKSMCLNVGAVSIGMPWLPTAWRAS